MRTALHRAFPYALALIFSLPPDAFAQLPAANAIRQAPKSADPKQAEKSFQRGKTAEAQGHLEEALAAFDEAAHLNPRDAAALEAAAVLRSRLVRMHVDEAEQFAVAARIDRATDELRAALRIDPGNPSVAERLSQISELGQSLAPSPAPAEQRLASIPRLRPQSGRRSLDLRGDTQTVYQQVAQAFGLTAAFDADLPSRPVRFRVDDVDFSTALLVLEAQTNTFVRPVNTGLMFVAQDTQAKRREYGLTVEQSFVLPDSVAPDEMSELLRILREITGSTHVQLNPANRTVTLRDSPETVALAGKLIAQAERARGQLLLDIEILEVDKNKALQLGISPPTTARLITIDPNAVKSVLQTKDLQSLLTLLQQILGGQGAVTGTGISVPPFLLVGGGKTTMLLTLPNAAAAFSDALTLVRSGRRVLLRAQNGKPATLFVGDRFPVTLSLLSASLGTSPFIPNIGGAVFPRSDFAVGKAPLALAVADFNGDNLRDIAVVNHNDNSITILLNQGQGNFTSATGSPILLGATQTGPSAIVAADINNDSKPDLLITNQTSNNVTILLGKGDGTFTPATGSPIAVGGGPSSIVAAEFNGDTNLDFAVTNSTDNTISVFLGDGTGGFKPAPGSPIALPASQVGPTALVTADFNGDGKADLAIVNRTSNNVSILLGNGDGTFIPATGSPISVGQMPVAVAAGDLNGDAKPDLAVVNQTDNTVSVLLNNGDATFAAAGNSPLATGATPAGVAIADFNADGKADIVVTDSGVNSLSLFIGLGAGLFSPRIALPTTQNPTAILAADMTGNGRADAVFTEEGSNQVSIIFNPGNFAGGNPLGIGQQPYPGSEYVDLGLKVKATPAMHAQDEVTLQLEFEIRALSGESVNGIPILSNRTLTQTVRVKEDETTLIGGLFDVEETRTLSGLPVLSQLPAASYFFSQHNPRSTDNELLILVTPRRLSLPQRISSTIYAGRDISPSSGREGPGPFPRGQPPLQPPQQPPLSQPPQQQPPPQP